VLMLGAGVLADVRMCVCGVRGNYSKQRTMWHL